MSSRHGCLLLGNFAFSLSSFPFLYLKGGGAMSLELSVILTCQPPGGWNYSMGHHTASSALSYVSSVSLSYTEEIQKQVC